MELSGTANFVSLTEARFQEENFVSSALHRAAQLKMGKGLPR